MLYQKDNNKSPRGTENKQGNKSNYSLGLFFALLVSFWGSFLSFTVSNSPTPKEQTAVYDEVNLYLQLKPHAKTKASQLCG